MRTCKLSNMLDPEGNFTISESTELADNLYPNLRSYFESSPEDLDGHSNELKSKLVLIYRQAFRMALVFRRLKTEFRWLQDATDWRPENLEAVASGGYRNLSEAVHAGNDFRTVFGGLMKASGPTGQIAERAVVLQKPTVLLGPFKAGQA